MGLDMYAYATREQPKAAVDFEVEQSDELAYWRKHPNLHGWMQRLYVEKGGNSNPSAFNCANLALTVEDIDQLETAVNTGKLPGTTGFFFGNDSDEYYRAEDLTFIGKARQMMADGYTVYYTSWW